MIPWTVAHQAPLSMGILQARLLESVAIPSSRGSSGPRTEPGSPALQADSLLSELELFSVFDFSYFFQDFGSFLLSLFRILCQVYSLSLPPLFGLVDIYSVPLPAGYPSASSSCLYCCVCGCLSVFWQFVEFSLLWCFLAVCGYVEVAYQGFLVREACVGVIVGGAGFLVSGVQ